MVHGAMLGALDSVTERESDEEEPSAKLHQSRLLFKAPASKVPFGEAIQKFEERNIVSKDVFEQLSAAAKQKAFTVAGLATEELLGDAHAELGRMLKDSDATSHFDPTTNKWVYKGPNLREFDKFAKERLESAGWTPANPSHVETIFRTNVASAYSGGRVAEMTQPDVLAARPYWQIRAVGDSRSRPAHKKANNTILAADHPFWRTCFTPFGFNCRCRVTSRSKRWVDAHGGPTMVPVGLPDPGFTCGTNELISARVQHQQEGTVAPQPPMNPAHAIDRAELPNVPKLSPTPPIPYTEPRKPEPFQPPTKFMDMVHAHWVSVGHGVTDAMIQTVFSALQPAELAVLQRDPIKSLVIKKQLPKRKGKRPNGSYCWNIIGTADELSVAVDRAPATYGETFKPGKTWSISASKATAEEAISTTTQHELGHRMHIRAGRAIDLEVAKAFESGNPITEYACQSRREYFAESYAAYRNYPAELLAHDPAGYQMVERVLDHWGMPHVK